MQADDLHHHLSSILTPWSVLRRANEGAGEAATGAQQQLLRCYDPAVRRYLLGVVRDPHIADDLAQEFGLCLLRGSFRGADPQRGRFRDYVKRVLFHLVYKYRQAERRNQIAVPLDSHRLADLAAPPDTDRDFDQTWRNELLARTWDALADAQPTYYAVLRFRAANREMSSADMAAQLGPQLGKPLKPAAVRQALHRAQDLYADLLLAEVARSLEPATPEQLDEELCELKLQIYCQRALDRYRRDRERR
jgi:RNA polymerase sigma-70 factor (ECF subfamily)